ncbi:MAG: hypothetical protein WCJ09_01965 [Planctomycetota bacterium]
MTEFLATFQVALPVLSAVTGLEALCFVLVGPSAHTRPTIATSLGDDMIAADRLVGKSKPLNTQPEPRNEDRRFLELSRR